MNTLTQVRQSNHNPPLRVAAEIKRFSLMSELNLVLACQQRESGAIEELLDRYKGSIKNIVYRLSPECTESADICQTAQIKVWRSISSLRQPVRFRAWLKRIVTNVFYDHARRVPKDFYLLSMDEPAVGAEDFSPGSTRAITDPAPQPEAIALGGELLDEIRKAISSIPKEFGTAMLLRDEEGLSYEQIACVTQSELGTVKSRISRARCKVQLKLAPYLDAAGCLQ